MTARGSGPPKPGKGKIPRAVASRALAENLQKQLDRRTRELAKTRKLLKEALQRQSATSEVLQVINSSSFELAPIFDSVLKRAMRLCEAAFGGLWVFEGDRYVAKALCGVPSSYVGYLRQASIVPGPHTAPYRFLHGERAAIQNIDLAAEEPYITGDPQRRALVDLGGARTALQVPLVRNDTAVGVITVYRQEVRPFSESNVTLLQDFAAQAVIAIANSRLFEEVQAKTRDLSEALTYQTASSNILGVIASSPTEVAPALQAIAESACTLCDAYDANVLLRTGNDLHFSAHYGPIPTGTHSRPISREWVTGRSVVDKVPVQVSDFEGPEAAEFPEGQRQSREQGHRCTLSVPLLREDEAIGAIVLRRLEPIAFNEKQIDLLQTFADQAVIAIENVRLFDEVQAKTRDLSEALTYQTGSANILRVIASSPTDVKPVLQAIVESACELCEAYDSVALLKDGDYLRFSAHHGPIPLNIDKWPINRKWVSGRAFVDQTPVHVHDLMAEVDEFPDGREMSVRMGHRTIVAVPLLREGESMGSLILRRTEVNPFSDKQIALLQTFADQAVIAIGNVHLFEEVQARTRDLSEALTYQTGSANILKVIASSPTDVQPVMTAIVESASKLCEADDALVTLREGEDLVFKAQHGSIPVIWQRQPITREWTAGRAVLDRKPIHVHDLLAPGGEQFPDAREFAKRTNVRTVLSVPLMREDDSVGAIVLRRTEVRPFDEKQITLLQTFADQAVIAIRNVRLFEEVQAKTRDLQEALTSQTGSANILKVIASSPTDVVPVLNAIVLSACDLCEAYDAVLRLRDGDNLRVSAHHGPIPTSRQLWPINRKWTAGCSVLDRKPIHVCDMMSAEGDAFPEGRELGLRTILSVPLLREGESIGSITLRRTEVNPFSDKQINLLQTFADQAVIAIGNVRLFEEVQERTRELTESLQQQTATADVLKVISASPGELEPVFQAMLENAVRLCEAQFAMLFLYDEKDNQYRAAGKWNLPTAWSEFLGKNPLPANPKVPLGQIAITRQPVQVADVLADQAYIDRYPGMVAVAELGGARTLLQVPMLKESKLVGAFGIYRQEVRPFTDKQVALVQNFAAQAVIAIENARLLNELRQRTSDLSKSLDDLRTAQDRLVQTEKLASLGQLTAGIAHEIKNPLNFVNNFAALSAELADDLKDILGPAPLADSTRAEVEEVTSLLKDNLEKVVQHGRRADSIVKNMLLHSREGSGEHRSADLNALVEESLNLAYHGARAEKPTFNVALKREFDPTVGTVEVFPQEITRVLLNLISNGFYAVSKRAAAEGAGFEPELIVGTRSNGDHAEIRIRDNGIGIPPEIKEKVFNPFFTTKPAGEGTGLGLSMSHDIIVKQHGGTIHINTEPGVFTEFVVTLARTTSSRNPARSGA